MTQDEEETRAGKEVSEVGKNFCMSEVLCPLLPWMGIDIFLLWKDYLGCFTV